MQVSDDDFDENIYYDRNVQTSAKNNRSGKEDFLREEYHDTSNVKRQRDRNLYMEGDQRLVEYRRDDDRFKQKYKNLECSRYNDARIPRDFSSFAYDSRHHDDNRHDGCHADDRRFENQLDHTSATTNMNIRHPYDGHHWDNAKEGGSRRLENQRRHPHDGHDLDKSRGEQQFWGSRSHQNRDDSDVYDRDRRSLKGFF